MEETDEYNEYILKKKFKLILPKNFQEVLVSWEIKFEKGDRSLETIKNIIYMYSVSICLIKMAMEYYDSINNREYYQYYLDKNKKMLINPEVISSLDKVNKILKNNKENNLLENSLFKIQEEMVYDLDNENCDLEDRSTRSVSMVNKKKENVSLF